MAPFFVAGFATAGAAAFRTVDRAPVRADLATWPLLRSVRARVALAALLTFATLVDAARFAAAFAMDPEEVGFLLFAAAAVRAFCLPFDPDNFVLRCFCDRAPEMAALDLVEEEIFLAEGIRGALLFDPALETGRSGNGEGIPSSS